TRSDARPAEHGEALAAIRGVAQGTGELAAGSAHLAAMRHAQERPHARVAQPLLEGADRLHGRRAQPLLRPGVEGDEILPDVEAAAEREQLLQMTRTVVSALDHRPLEEDWLARLRDRGAQRGEIPESRRGKQRPAVLVVGGVEADRQPIPTPSEK